MAHVSVFIFSSAVISKYQGRQYHCFLEASACYSLRKKGPKFLNLLPAQLFLGSKFHLPLTRVECMYLSNTPNSLIVITVFQVTVGTTVNYQTWASTQW